MILFFNYIYIKTLDCLEKLQNSNIIDISSDSAIRTKYNTFKTKEKSIVQRLERLKRFLLTNNLYISAFVVNLLYF